MTEHVIKMPDIGEGIAEVEIVEWHVAIGDSVIEDQILADVMTDKASVQIPSPVFGKVTHLGGQPGDIMAVGANLITLEVDQLAAEQHREAIDELSSAGSTNRPLPTHAAPEPTTATIAASEPVPVVAAVAASVTTPAVAAVTAPVVAVVNPDQPHLKPLASPSVRRQARELGIDLYQVQPRDEHGLITHAILAAHKAGTGQSATPGVSKPGAVTAAPASAADGQHQIPVIGLRRKIAQKMQESKRHIPHFTYVEEVDVTELENLRVQLNHRWGNTRGKLTVLPFLARAMVLALKDFPQINARYDDTTNIITRYDAVHLGVAAQTDAGLMVPVLRHAQTMDLWQCASGIARLAGAARSGKATVQELTGSTITLTSLGALGGIVSTPVINHPEVGIVGVNRIVERPMIVGGAVVARKMMNLSSSFDHRVVDGMHAAQFIQAIRAYLECPATLFID
ncbi:MAG: 2-oxo acid dehydrogenase subunit E2 [Burkholderiaceae bacterium]|nr:2-oxo acid dehydrogenase subunit E2 [Burkholderiaceae bacterium]